MKRGIQNLDLESLESWQTRKKQQFCAFCGWPKNDFCTPFLSTESIDDTQIKSAWNFEWRILTLNLQKPTKRNSFAPFVVDRRTLISRHFFCNRIYWRHSNKVCMELRMENFDAWILTNPQKATVLRPLWLTEERFLSSISLNRIYWRHTNKVCMQLWMENCDLQTWQTHTKQQFCALCGRPKNAFCTPFLL